MTILLMGLSVFWARSLCANESSAEVVWLAESTPDPELIEILESVLADLDAGVEIHVPASLPRQIRDQVDLARTLADESHVALRVIVWNVPQRRSILVLLFATQSGERLIIRSVEETGPARFEVYAQIVRTTVASLQRGSDIGMSLDEGTSALEQSPPAQTWFATMDGYLDQAVRVVGRLVGFGLGLVGTDLEDAARSMPAFTPSWNIGGEYFSQGFTSRLWSHGLRLLVAYKPVEQVEISMGLGFSLSPLTAPAVEGVELRLFALPIEIGALLRVPLSEGLALLIGGGPHLLVLFESASGYSLSPNDAATSALFGFFAAASIRYRLDTIPLQAQLGISAVAQVNNLTYVAEAENGEKVELFALWWLQPVVRLGLSWRF